MPSAELIFADSSSIAVEKVYEESGNAKTISSKIFDNTSFKIYEGDADFTAIVKIKGTGAGAISRHV